MPSQFDHHNNLIKLMKELGYTSNEEGICHGITLMAIQACATNRITTFNNRLLFIKKHPNLKAEIESFRNKAAHEDTLTLYEQKIIDVIAFLDGIELHYNPELYAHLFSEPVTYINSDKISQIIASPLLEHRGGLVKAMSWPGIYTNKELTRYCKLLDKMATTIHKPFSILFSHLKHTTALHYDPEQQKWYSLDANELPIKPICIDLASWMKNVLHEEGNITAFETSIFLAGNDHIALQKFEERIKISLQFTKLHDVTVKKANYKSSNGTTLAIVATKYGHAEVITALHTAGVDLNEFLEDGTTIAYMAATKGHVNIINALHAASVDLSKPIHNGKTPSLAAAHYNHVLTLKALDEAGVDLIKKTPYGTPLRIARKHNAVECIRFLEDYIVRKNKSAHIKFFSSANMPLCQPTECPDQTAIVDNDWRVRCR